ncbi:serine/threonine-protein phosphatase PGAM5, mitochondrial-like isoform X2 [Strongylocentrotus purpuratus]|uniref:Serine/threonine-protein phosphatase PGAM5, mitochondrial n=1 Tax=Strongylocentrotus purpuratus TaxID=7668 RepID=A0A7M7MX30_STRPU|nr:serine/threonine-protein phosphatase PGAM5, mitochondrial isoform X2 [Strongylocentrotus purpuratus]XP_030827832.1 serine/threonine-protein phosphatase PGAM5, mitochondrial-like isoform X2 [Strongylocentrotus purpuratus]|eukprot:XP_011673375.1 PREDICTED: serine/threonine-protein phosphatase PGAM5, mitochondrial isoform X2 [Strongylocentrotus purpuratus]
MPAFNHGFRAVKLIFGISGGVAFGAAAVGYSRRERDGFLPTALAAWTTNHNPSVRWDTNWDKRDPESLINPSRTEVDSKDPTTKLTGVKPTATRHLILIRHGQYNTDGITDDERILTALGREQAAMTGQRLKALNHPYTTIINSTMARAIETADIISAQIPDIPRETYCELLREGAPIPPEPPVGHWKPEVKFYEDGARIEAAFRKYFHRADPAQTENSFEVIVCHANVIRYFVCRAMQFPPEAWLRMSLYHGSITWVSIRPSGRVSLRALGDAGFMPANKVSVS